jgi:hypothetical protein
MKKQYFLIFILFFSLVACKRNYILPPDEGLEDLTIRVIGRFRVSEIRFKNIDLKGLPNTTNSAYLSVTRKSFNEIRIALSFVESGVRTDYAFDNILLDYATTDKENIAFIQNSATIGNLDNKGTITLTKAVSKDPIGFYLTSAKY